MKQPDDLLNIKGIGQARQQWLRETFQVQTYGDLANLTVEDISARLKKGQIVSHAEIESWIEQARLLAEAAEQTHESAWNPFASFVVEYARNQETGDVRTKVHHMEADETMEWAGVEQREVSAWIAQHLGIEDDIPEVLELPTSSSTPLAATPSAPPAYSTELQRVLAKAASLGRGGLNKEQSGTQTLPVAGAIQQGGFSDDLLKAIAKAERLAGKR